MKMRFALKTRSISTELTVSLFLLVLLVEGILLLIVYSRQSQFLQQELERKADIYGFNLSEVLGVPIWNIDDEQVENIGSVYTQNEIVNGLYIRDSEGKSLFEFHKPEVAKNDIKRYTKIAYKNQVVGSAELFISIDRYNVDLAWMRNLIVLVLTGSLIVIFIATGFLLRVYIRRPMSVLQDGIDRVAKGDYSYKFDEIYHRELSGIAKRIEEMAVEIQNREISLKNEVSERKRTEESLRESERRYRSLNENIPVGVFRSKPSGEILSLNLALLQMLDIPDDRAVSQMRAGDLYLMPGDRQRMLNEIARDKQVKGFECRLKKKDDDAIWVSISARGIEDDSGRIKYLDGIVEDIHGRKMAEEAQRESREFRKRIFESSMIPIMVMDPETFAFIDCNPAATAIYRFSSTAETLEKTPLDVSVPVQSDGTPSSEKMKYYTKKAITDGMVVFDWRHQHTNGEIWDAEVHLMSFQSEERQLLQLTIQDITERKQAEEALYHSEAQNRLLLEQVHGIVWTVDKDLRFTSSRGAGLANIGLKPDQVVGQRLQEFIGSETAQAIKAVQQAFSGQSVKYEDYWGGTPWESRVEPLRDHSDQIVGSIAISLDITERKQAEEELNRYRDQLESLVKERTFQLEKEIDVRKKAERRIAASLAEKEVLLREIHHRVKNNLNTVSNLLYLQSLTIEDSRVAEAFGESRNRIQTMARVHELLYHSESLTWIDMNDYVKELMADLVETNPTTPVAVEADASGVRLEIDQAIPCGLLVTELVSNSLKYAFPTHSPGDRITVRLSVDRNASRLEVSDNGSGLPDGLQVDELPSLGLRLVGMLTRQLHGTYEIQSAPGQGTQFTITFNVTD